MKFKSNKGFGLVEILVALGIMSVVGLGVSTLITNSFKQQKQIVSDSNIDALREMILKNLQNDQAFLNTLKNPANSAVFQCINNAVDCASAGGEFKLFDKNNSALAMSSLSSEATSGFNLEGIQCNDFNSVLGNDSCPFKYVATWAADCYQTQNIKGKASVETACRNPLIKINVDFISKASANASLKLINNQKMKVSVIKSQNDAALADQGKMALKKMCEEMSGGVFDASASTCILPSLSVLNCENICGPNRQSLVKGFHPDGTLKCSCAMFPVANCNAPGTIAKVLSAISPVGTIACNNGVIPDLVATGDINEEPVVYTGDGGGGCTKHGVTYGAGGVNNSAAIGGDGGDGGGGGGS